MHIRKCSTCVYGGGQKLTGSHVGNKELVSQRLAVLVTVAVVVLVMFADRW